MVSWIAVGSVTPGWYSTVACSVARLTAARETPGTTLNPCSILATHDAQDMPSIGIVSVADLPALVIWFFPRRWSAAFARSGVIVTIGTGAWPMPRDLPFRTASGSFSKVRLHPGAQK